MGHDSREKQAAECGLVTRAIEITLDPSPSQQRWLRSYVGSMRVAYNWALEQVATNLAVRRDERARGVGEDELTPALSWSRESLTARWRQVRDEVHPWHRDVSIHAFRTGLDNAALALRNFAESRAGKRRGPKVGFPRFKNRHSRQAVTFVELADGVDHRHWINRDTHAHVRLMLPRRAGDSTWERRHTRPKSQQAQNRDRRSEVAWLHTHQPDTVREVWRLCESGRAKVQALTIKFEGGRWKAVFRLRLLDGSGRLRNPGEPVRYHGGAVGVDLGLKHLVTLDRPVAGLTDEHGHVPNPRVLDKHLARLRRLDRAIARCEKGSRNRAKLLRRRARLHGRITATRRLFLHERSRRLAGGFDLVCVEDLNVAGMARKGLRNGRSVAEASMGELVRQLDYKPPTGPPVWCRPAATTPVRRPARSAGREPSSRCGNGSTTATTAAHDSTVTSTPHATSAPRDNAFCASTTSPRYAGRRETASRDPVRPNPHRRHLLMRVRVGTGRSRPQPFQQLPPWWLRERRTRPRHLAGDGVGFAVGIGLWAHLITPDCRT